MRKLEYKHWVAIIYILVLFLDRLDITIVNITLPTLAAYFRVPISATSAVNTSFLLALAIAIPISDWLGTRFGTQRIFIMATALFGFTSFLCAFAPNLTILTFLRYLQGIGGGIIIPVGMTMVYRNFAPEEHAKITSYIFMPALLAPALAPALGGAFIKWLSWQWVFIFAAPICLIAVVLASIKLREVQQTHTAPLDWLGFILISLSLSLLFYAIDSAGKNGLTAAIWLQVLLGIILMAIFIWHEKRTALPLIDLHFFKSRTFIQANLIQLAFQNCHYGSFFLIGIYLQVYVHMSALAAGCVIGMQALGAFAVMRYSVRFYNRHGAGVSIIVSLIGVALLSLAILTIQTPDQFIEACVLMFIRGICSGLCGIPIQMMSIIDFNKAQVGKANAIFNTSRQLAISLSIAVFSLLIAYHLPQHHNITALQQQVFYIPFLLIPVMAILGIIVALTVRNEKFKLS